MNSWFPPVMFRAYRCVFRPCRSAATVAYWAAIESWVLGIAFCDVGWEGLVEFADTEWMSGSDGVTVGDFGAVVPLEGEDAGDGYQLLCLTYSTRPNTRPLLPSSHLLRSSSDISRRLDAAFSSVMMFV